MKLSSVKSVTGCCIYIYIYICDRPDHEQATENDEFLLAPFNIRWPCEYGNESLCSVRM